ncbi:tRNA(Met) cytidine acetyltransferase TmcA [Allochromatium palmeri]|uniref:tRNA(Met) cytidine acetyltransferase TmcA n=1 Tax=Allochromatium palmeri TaxID=231048 RepID=A0A6N8E9S7_9GAMM|nr:GNAT family N-acetyltransferase [Allochromatium palmeri]MTW21042.1 GNAT family N-acetyltransferase [Allochromatium palmeri]
METEQGTGPACLGGLPAAQWFRVQRESAQARGHRLTLWLRGSPEWTAAGARRVVAALPELDRVCLAERPILAEPSRPLRTATRLLGQDLELLILDVHSGFDPDGFGAATGAIRGGGLLVLLTPPVAEWACRPDPQAERIAVWPFAATELSRGFIARLISVLESDPTVVRIDQDHLESMIGSVEDTCLTEISPLEAASSHDLSRPSTPDQALAVDAILKTAHGRARRPLVLTAHRGRGKSAALGLAAGRLLVEGGRRLLVTAPRRAAVETLYRHAEAVWIEAAYSASPSNTCDAATGLQSLAFHSPAELLEHGPEADLLLVDEAAGIPAPVLTALLERYGRIVFASTVHGYEGTGRGFEICFRDTLERLTPNWRAISLDTPIRWADDDPLEPLVFRALLLDAAPAPREAILAGAAVDPVDPSAEWLDRDALLGDEATLRELFGLLVLAHYQTRPLDLRMLLDGPNVRVLVLRQAGHLVGTLLVAEEGGMLDPALRAAIFRGQRRPRGHLLPQTLSAHAGLMDAPLHRYWRVIRIVVHPAVTGQGLGQRLLAELERAARIERIDLLGASFGATTELLEFWCACGFVPAQIGVSRNAASGEHAAVVLRAISEQGARLLEKALRRLASSLPVWLAGPLRALDSVIAATIIAALPPPDTDVAELTSPTAVTDWRLELEAFVEGHRTLESSLPLLAELTYQRLAAALSAGWIDRDESALLVAVTLQFQPLTGLARRFEARGREALLARLRQVGGRLIGR